MRSRRRRPTIERIVPRTREERINDEIRAPRVRLVDEDGTQIGITETSRALEIAYGKGLDLVEVAPNADPPV
ncbi:MAG: translation initiation factor IF-3, partial [Gaiellaceae bacterium]|nr:translation initiation factor IF-3 [Gaiellaceae bacterium]